MNNIAFLQMVSEKLGKVSIPPYKGEDFNLTEKEIFIPLEFPVVKLFSNIFLSPAL